MKHKFQTCLPSGKISNFKPVCRQARFQISIAILSLLLIFLVNPKVVLASSQGPNSPQTIVNGTSGIKPFTNPGFAVSNDNNYATVLLGGYEDSKYLTATNFGFSIPQGSTINGVMVEVKASGDHSQIWNNGVFVLKGGNKTSSTAKITKNSLGLTNAYFAEGSSTYLWNTSWTADDINSTGFGAAFSCFNLDGNSHTCYVDHIRITVYYTPSSSATVPGAPTNVSAAAGNAQATVSWTAPGSNGGSAITGYTVTSSPGGFTTTSTATSATVTGLANGTSYTFTVKATNSVGTGPASAASNSVTPTANTSPTPPCGNYGDVNGDGTITASDATIILFYSIGFQSLTADQRRRADVNGDLMVDATDSGVILRYIAGYISTFPVCETFDYTLSVTQHEFIIAPGSSASVTVVKTLTPTSTISKNVTLSISSVLPAGVTASILTNNPCSPTCSSIFTLTVAYSATPGRYPIVISATPANVAGGTTIISLVIPPPAPTIAANIPNNCINPDAGYSGGGITISWNSANNSGIDWVDIDDDNLFDQSPEILYFHKQVSNTTSTKAPEGFSLATASTPLVLSPSKTYYVRTFNSQTRVHSQTATFGPISVCAVNYSLASSGNITLTQGSSGSSTITNTLISGPSPSVTLSASGLPAGATASFSNNPCNPTCSNTLTIAASATTPLGNYDIRVSGSPATTGIGSVTLKLTVNVKPVIPPVIPIVSCGLGNPVRSKGLVTAPAVSGKFSSSGGCITDPKSAFVPFKIPTFDDLKSLYYTQSKARKVTELKGNNNDYVYYTSGDLTLDSPSDITGNQTGVVFVNGKLFITKDIKGNNPKSGLVLIARGDVIVDPTVIQIDAVIISSGVIFTAGANCDSSSIQTNQLTINGSLISLTETNPIRFCRQLTDNTLAAEVIKNQVKYLVILKDLLSDTYQKWAEIP